jgi:hypothetical protein
LIYYSVWVHVNTCLWKPWFMKQSIHSSQCVSTVSLAWWILISMLLEWIMDLLLNPRNFFLIDAGMKYCNMDRIIFHIISTVIIYSQLSSLLPIIYFHNVNLFCLLKLFKYDPWMKNTEPSLISSLEQK